jgi:hypothetical protein
LVGCSARKAQTSVNTTRGYADCLQAFCPFRELWIPAYSEAVYSFLKTQYNLAINKVRGVENIASYAIYSLLRLVLNREVAENLGRPDKAISPTFFNT